MSIYENLQQDTGLEDGVARLNAIDPSKSFIVQAPAGSGKTSLLTQRFLALLAVVESPEQIIAMTFTKKAVAEMQLRILKVLEDGLNTSKTAIEQQSIYNQNTWHLAQLALTNNNNRGWNLLENPHRLRIKTIDSFNSYLVQQMPLLANFGQENISQQVDELYQLAARETLNSANIDEQIISLMNLVNGDKKSAQQMLAKMLLKRDQWMPLLHNIQDDTDIHVINVALENIVNVTFSELISNISSSFDILQQLKNILDEVENIGYLDFNKIKLTQLNTWQNFISFLITKSGTIKIRSIANFTATTKQEQELKKPFKALLAQLDLKNFNGDLVKNLQLIATLPATEYTQQQYLGINNLCALLTTAVAHLKLVFIKHNTTDFIEIAQAASKSLGTDEHPTDLAQRLDYQIQHLLIDEFQDTSVSQFVLLKKLIAGWSLNDNHSLFIVGDPMQSIYRFREAEVGNFLEAWQGQIGQFKLHKAQLSINFRSNFAVVDWVNKAFCKIMPTKNNIAKGAVSYTKSIAFSSNLNDAINLHWQVNCAEEDMVKQVVTQIKQTLKNKQTAEKIGILGRTKSVLIPIIKELKQQNIAFRAIEIETLASRQEIQDLESLTRALIHLNDRAAWIALLRTPAIGLSLIDLAILLEDKSTLKQSVWAVLSKHKQTDFQQLSSVGKARLDNVYDILENAISKIGLVSWARLIKETWLFLDFAQGIEEQSLLQNIEAFWVMLEGIETENKGIVSKFNLTQSLQVLFALPDDNEQSNQIEIMTMHKSKGLEFDYVFLPELNKRPRSDDKQLVTWLHFKHKNENKLIFAPMAQKGKDKASIADTNLVNFITNFEKEKQLYELGRLLYVACTRAKQQLHLFANVDYTEKLMLAEKDILPINNSLLSIMWAGQKQKFNNLAKQTDFNKNITNQPKKQLFVNRIPVARDSFINNSVKETIKNIDKSMLNAAKQIAINNINSAQVKYENRQAIMVSAVGNLVHNILELWGNQQTMPTSINTTMINYLKYWLQQQSIEQNMLNEALARTMVSLKNAIANTKIRWALTSNFVEAASEMPMTSLGLEFADKDSAEAINHIVDRTFIDENDTRWIIDYKTSYFVGEDKQLKQQFINQQIQKYKPQLTRYAQLFQHIKDRPQINALYFSYLDEFVVVAD